jgi:hypothetical protein
MYFLFDLEYLAHKYTQWWLLTEFREIFWEGTSVPIQAMQTCGGGGC